MGRHRCHWAAPRFTLTPEIQVLRTASEGWLLPEWGRSVHMHTHEPQRQETPLHSCHLPSDVVPSGGRRALPSVWGQAPEQLSQMWLEQAVAKACEGAVPQGHLRVGGCDDQGRLGIEK